MAHMNRKMALSKRTVFIAIAVLCILLAWVFLWQRVGDKMEQAELDAYYTGFSLDGAIYARYDMDFIADTYDLTLTGTAADCGSSLEKAQFTVEGVMVSCPVYRVKALEDQSLADAVVLVERGGVYHTYELVGFTSLSESPSIGAVCEAYGIGAADDLVSVTVHDADGTMLRNLTTQEDLAAFYAKFAALGEDMGAEGQAQAYYDVYVDRYGESDAIALENGVITTADDETYQQAMELWGAGMCTVTVMLKNGLRLGDMVYAPVPKVFQAYGYYRITEPFFE